MTLPYSLLLPSFLCNSEKTAPHSSIEESPPQLNRETKGCRVRWIKRRHLGFHFFRKPFFYSQTVCTSQFVVVFAGGDGSGGKKQSSDAYISQSTRGLRSLLREHDVCFSMPLCRSKVEQVTTEDLVELSEIEKRNLGQTRRLGSISDVDNSPQSLLSFSGNKDVHTLYDFMLNYRSFFTSLTSVDVPLLYSPVPFQHAALSAPKVSCRELKRADHVAFPLKGSKMKDEANESVSAGLSYSIEI